MSLGRAYGGDVSVRAGSGISPFNSVVIVQGASDLAGPLDSSKVYVIDGPIDMGTTPIQVPSGGLSIDGLGFNVSKLQSSEDGYKMFTSDPGDYPGDLIISGVEMTVTGSGSQIFDLDNEENFNAVELVDSNFFGCTAIGELTNYRQLFMTGSALIRCLAGMTFSGNMAGGVTVIDSILIEAGVPFAGTVLKAGTDLVIGGSVRSNFNGLAISSGDFCNFAPSNITLDGAFQMEGTRMPTNIDAFPNMPASSVKARFTNAQGSPNTYPGAAMTISADALNTVSNTGEYLDMEGIGTYTDLVWFSQYQDNGLQYESDEEIDVVIEGTLDFTGGNNDTVGVQIWKYTAATTSWDLISPTFNGTMNGGTSGLRAEGISFGAYTNMQNGDRIQLRVANTKDTSDVTTAQGGSLFIRER